VTPPVPFIDLATTSPVELVGALRSHACVVLATGHGVPDDVWWSLVEVSKAFFDQPDAVKEPTRWDGEWPWRGWLPSGSTDNEGGTTTKLLEKFEVHLPHPSPVSGDDIDGRAASFDLWPSAPDGFVAAWVRAFDALGALAERVVTMVMDGLALPGQLRDAWTTRHHANLVVNDYMALAGAPSSGQVRHPAHVDIGGITLLSAQDAPGGLEVRVDDSWLPVSLPPNAHLVQAGDLLRRWTNNVIPGNLHRVVNPPADVAATARRTSVAYFHYPALDTEVVPAPSCVSGIGERGALRSGEHMLLRQRRALHDVYDDEFA
jgi:isopenicillin N synthase-like dioxygenase